MWAHVHDDTRKRKQEKKTDTWDNKKNENELPQVGFEPTTLHSALRTEALTNWATKAAQLHVHVTVL